MKIKKLHIGKNENSLAIMVNNQWIVLKSLLAMFPDDRSDEYAVLTKVSDDLISFLQRLPNTKEKLISLLPYADTGCAETAEMIEIMPFRPKFFRDFMLYERHFINSTRGMVKLSMKRAYPIISAYEKFFRRTFPAFKPAKAYYENPVYYKGNILSFTCDGETVTYPQYATILDYELELGMIIAKDIINADEQEGLDAIGAFCVFNDFTARNVQYDEMIRTSFGPCKAKDFASSISNIVVTPDEVLPYLSEITTRVYINDKLIATGQANEFTHSFGSAVAYASKGEKVYAGEFMASGTIPNCCGVENGNLLSRGDTIRLEIDRIGSLTNKVE